MTLNEKMDVIMKLQKVVDKYVNYWKEDFLEDQKHILAKSNDYPMLFLARECGTVLVSFDNADDWSISAINDICHGAMETVAYYLNNQPEEIRMYAITDGKVAEIKTNRLVRGINLIDQVQTLLLSKVAA